jgi:Glycosyl hydrolases family 25
MTAYPGLFYPDISSDQAGISLTGMHAVCVKRSEGTYYLNPAYETQVAAARQAGAFCFAYHFLTDESPQAQARYCFQNLGRHVGLMVDVETEIQTGSQPTLAQNLAFVRSFRSLGGNAHLNYLPRWYWSQVWGEPDLAGLRELGMVLVSSDYSGYATGAGWAAYGGWTPTIWQYSSTVPVGTLKVDFNAFLGSGGAAVPALVSELRSVVLTGKLRHEPTTANASVAPLITT